MGCCSTLSRHSGATTTNNNHKDGLYETERMSCGSMSVGGVAFFAEYAQLINRSDYDINGLMLGLSWHF
ncbi:hypothetical protein GCM10022421_18060 [Oceanisphaera sediminis]|uniref:Outer membrane protein beta-barrel domain-containing protein n=1 Tax=Oceanisphaera sediminis TaxID=981381 RepID=A0ABP7DY70_9GAMM